MAYFNCNKHTHRGVQYLSYKAAFRKHKKKEKHFSVKGGYLREFWLNFNRANQTRRLELLQEASKIKYPFNKKVVRKGYGFRDTPCKVCGRTPTIVHHIVLLGQGGQDKHRNRILICKHCHAQIHEWLMDDLAAELHNEMDNECRMISEQS
jgi:hypothetical protein